LPEPKAIRKGKTVQIEWSVGILPEGDIFIHFQSDTQHFKCTMDDETARKMGAALVDVGSRKSPVTLDN
jgi:hypothetical protein